MMMFLVTLALFVMMVMLVIIKLRMGSVKALASFLVVEMTMLPGTMTLLMVAMMVVKMVTM